MTGKNIEDVLAENVKKSYCCSYEDYKEYHAKMLASITESAQLSPVYRGQIKKAADLEQLADLPITMWKDVEDAVEKDGLDNVLLAKPVKFWQTSGYSGKPKKVWFGEKDIEGMHLSILEMLYITGAFETDMSIWNIGVADPYLPGTLFDDCFSKYIDTARTRVSYYSEAATDEDGFVKTLNMISQVRGVNILIAYPVVYYLIAMSSSRPEWLESKVIDGFCRLKVLPFRVLPASFGKAFAKFYLRKVDYANIRNILGSTEMLVQAFQATPDTEELSVALKNYIPEIASVEYT
jgi:phenylacetate-coenzyme A ligase PaaK-like adenylate-forming protein